MFENSIFKIEFSILLGLFPHHNLYRLTFQSFVLRELYLFHVPIKHNFKKYYIKYICTYILSKKYYIKYICT